MVIAVGEGDWTLPIPLVESGAGWRFDLEAGAGQHRERDPVARPGMGDQHHRHQKSLLVINKIFFVSSVPKMLVKLYHCRGADTEIETDLFNSHHMIAGIEEFAKHCCMPPLRIN